MQIDAKWLFYLGLTATILGAISNGSAQLQFIPHDIAVDITQVNSLLLNVITGLMTFLAGFSSSKTGPLVSLPKPPGASIILFVIVSGAVLMLLSIPAHAQTKGHDLLQDIARRNGDRTTSSEVQMAGNAPEDQIIGKINELGNALIIDLQSAYNYASFTDASGQMADAAAAPCYKALIPVVQLVVNGPPSSAPATTTAPTTTTPAATTTDTTTAPPVNPQPGLVTKVEKIRIIRIALQSQALKNSCAPLVQDVQSQVTSVLSQGAGIARIITGLGVAIP